MQSLILAILSSAAVSVIMRFSEGKIRNRMCFFLANYAVCTLLALGFALEKQTTLFSNGFGFALGLGAFSGFLFLYSFVLFRQNVARNGMVMSATFMKLGVLIPTLMAILVFRETPRAVQIIGIILAVAAILLLHLEKGDSRLTGKWMLILLLVVSGLTDGTANIYDKLGTSQCRDLFLVATFFTAMFLSGIPVIARREALFGADLLFGAAIGIPNYFSSRFLLGALTSIPAVVVYPVYSVGTILVITAVGLLVFRESLDKRRGLAMLLILAALAMLNV